MASPLRAPLLLMAVLALASASTPKQSPRLLGGLQEANVNEEGVQRAVDFAISEYNKGSNDAYHSRAMQVLRARKQIVAGVNYYLDVMVGRTTCTKSQPNLAECPFHDQPHLMRVNHERNEVPADGKLAALEELLQPLFSFFTQLHHGDDGAEKREINE
ncbi:Cystatin-C [Microtus ochrogaster]|uniref:Cystatin-C n=1 Tax=Microtus ochrogaster TaxID=79684 RepID=A0A8J6GP68_MICOH|nr:Cystatin-C [Microtus ochrogaster]